MNISSLCYVAGPNLSLFPLLSYLVSFVTVSWLSVSVRMVKGNEHRLVLIILSESTHIPSNPHCSLSPHPHPMLLMASEEFQLWDSQMLTQLSLAEPLFTYPFIRCYVSSSPMFFRVCQRCFCHIMWQKPHVFPHLMWQKPHVFPISCRQWHGV